MSRRPLVAGNWKMNGDAELATQIQALFDKQSDNASLAGVDVLICPPAVFLHLFQSDSVLLGGQNLSEFTSGAHTGEISGSMLTQMDCQFVIVGHSERRTDNAESNTVVARKTEAALESGLTPVVCVGEPEEVRDKGDFFDYIAEQLNAVINQVGIASFDRIIVAYEPIWAIGTGKTASPEQAQEVHGFIRQHLARQDESVAEKVRILYGGSVKAANAEALFSKPDIDGGLIGGASLDPQDFLNICLAAKG